MINETDMTRQSLRWVRLFVAFLLAATAAFVIGVAVERSQEHREPAGTSETPETPIAGEPGTPADDGDVGEHGEEGEGHEPIGGDEAAEDAEQHSDAGGDETVFGVDPESTPAVVTVVAVSLLLVGLVWWWPMPWVLLGGAAFCAAAAAFDVREVVHQVAEDRTGVATVAVLVAVLHAAAAVCGLVAAQRRRSVVATRPLARH